MIPIVSIGVTTLVLMGTLVQFIGCSSIAPVSGSSIVPASVGSGAPASVYCTKNGGVVQTRHPVMGTNNDKSQWVNLAGTMDFCQWKASDGSRIYASLDTLNAEKPTLAALAWYGKPKPVTDVAKGNPASQYCSQLGGSDLFGGVNAAGGGWVLDNDNPDEVLEACIFPDLSTIDSWGLTYHANGIIRGTDLSKVLRYQPSK